MKKLLSLLLLIILLLVTALTGCGSDNSTQKTEEELKEEIRAEMEAEKKAAEEAEKVKEEETVVGPTNMAIKKYQGEGLERLTKIEVDTKNDYVSNTKDVQDKLAIFGEVTNVKIGYIRLYTDGNYLLLKEFDSLKDTELTILRASGLEDLITVSFYDQGFREHIFTFTNNDQDNYIYSEAEDEQELFADLADKDKTPTSYGNKSNLILNSLGQSEKQFLVSNIFNNIQEQFDDYYGETFYQVIDEPLGYDFSFMISNNDIYQVYISPNENYESIKDDAKCSFFGVDFDMSIYQARYNLVKTNANISIDLSESYEGNATGKLTGINIMLK